MRAFHRDEVWIALSLALATVMSIGWRFHEDMGQARDRVAQGSVLIKTRCGPIEYAETGGGWPLLAAYGRLWPFMAAAVAMTRGWLSQDHWRVGGSG